MAFITLDNLKTSLKIIVDKLNAKADSSALQQHTEQDTLHVTEEEKQTWNNKAGKIVTANNTQTFNEIFNDYTNNIASGDYSHAEGSKTKTSGYTSHAEGYQTKATGDYSHAEGYYTTASGLYSHAEGDSTKATGHRSHAEGCSTTASGMYSHAEGDGTKASSIHQHVQGKHNIEDVNNKYAHIVGNGKSYTKRSNAHTLDWSGNAWFAGDVYVGGTSQDDASTLASTTYVDNKVADLVNSAPETLNTLNELAAALGNDENFATTVTNSLAEKASNDDLNTHVNNGDIHVTSEEKALIAEIENLKNNPIVQTPDWNQNDESAPDYIKNRTHYVIDSGFEITWDGEIGDRFSLDLSTLGMPIVMVKVSDQVLTEDQLIGSTYIEMDNTSGDNNIYTIDKSEIEYLYPGSFSYIGVTVVHSADDLNSALGLPSGYLTNGVYFALNNASRWYTTDLIAPKKIKKIDPKFLPEGIGYEIPSKFDIQWDGNMDGRDTVNMTPYGFAGMVLIKVSDKVLTDSDLLGSQYISNEDDIYNIDESYIDTTSFGSGAVVIDNGWVVSVISKEQVYNDTMISIPSNGLYFAYNTNNSYYTARLLAPTEIVKIDKKFLPDMDVDLSSLSAVARTGNYNDLYNKPTIYTDTIRYNTTQSLSLSQKTTVRNNIDVYSKSEVQDMINTAIGNAIGGEY